jgi:hypothetical protein
MIWILISEIANPFSTTKPVDILRINIIDGCGGGCVREVMEEIGSQFRGSITGMAYSDLKRAIYIRYSTPIDTAKLGEILRKRGVKYEIRY